LRAIPLCVSLLLGAAQSAAQYQSDDPSDATTSLPFTTTTGGEVVICTTGSESAGQTLNSMTNTALAIVPAPLCGTFTSGTTNDVWFRINVPGAGDNRFRITIKDGAANPLTNGGMAAYTATSAAGPFTLIDCAIGGNLTNTATNPTLEATCIAPSSKIYLRVWDEAAVVSTKNFNVCVQGQLWSDPTRQPIADTPCDVYATGTPTIMTVGAAIATYYNTFACTENFPYDPSCGGYRGGDIWFRTTVPATGGIALVAQVGANTGRRISSMGFTVYTAPNCASYNQFNEVGCVNVALPATATTILTLSCLPVGSFVWIRGYATADAELFPSRFGAFRFRVIDALTSPGSAANNDPCGATAISIGAAGSCSTLTSGLFTFNDNTACFSQGIPAPGCGVISSNTRDVWFKFTAPANGTAAIKVMGDTTNAIDFDAAAALYTAGPGLCNGPLTLVDCDDRHAPHIGAYMVRNGLVPGQTYYLRVWGEAGLGTQTGIFYVCITSPVAPAGYCFYQVDLTALNTQGSQTIRVAIGTDTVDYTTTRDASERFLIAIPNGVTASFIYYNAGTSGQYAYSIYRFGQRNPLYSYTGGIAVVGPSPGPVFQYTVNNTCGPMTAEDEDCLGSTRICGPAAVASSTLGNTGYIADLNVTNRGCLGNEYNGGTWFVFRAQANGRIAFWLQGTIATDDLDFAIWDAGPTPTAMLPYVSPSVCVPNAPPVRCSSARIGARTGLQSGVVGRFSEGAGGFGWLSPLDVVADHVYLMFVGNRINHTAPRNFQLNWTESLDEFGAADNTVISCGNIILPVRLLFLTATPRGGEVDILWATGAEKDSDHFTVERSSNGVDFDPIGSVPAVGYSSTRQDYLFTDTRPMTGYNYYRLRQVDTNGAAGYSQMVVAFFGDPLEKLLLFPNPANEVLYITGKMPADGTMYMVVADATGRTVLTATSSASQGAFQQQIDISGLSAGAYMMQTFSNGIPSGNGLFVKR